MTTEEKSTNENRTIVSAWVGEPGEDIMSDFMKKYDFVTNLESTCFHMTPLLFLYITHMLVFVSGLTLYRYFKANWFATNDNPKIDGYAKLDEDRLSLHSL